MDDFHSLFYYKVLAPLQNLQGDSGPLSGQYRAKKDTPEFVVAYEPRADHYDHNYMRDKFLAKRDRLMVFNDTVLLSETRSGDKVTVYSSAVALLFPGKETEALDELKELLEKFYEVTIEDVCPHSYVDYAAEGRNAQHSRVGTSRSVRDQIFHYNPF